MRAVALLAVTIALLAGCGGSDSSSAVVPYVVGLREPLATQAIEEIGLEPEIKYAPHTDMREGFVYAQSIREGTEVDERESITISVSTGPP